LNALQLHRTYWEIDSQLRDIDRGNKKVTDQQYERLFFERVRKEEMMKSIIFNNEDYPYTLLNLSIDLRVAENGLICDKELQMASQKLYEEIKDDDKQVYDPVTLKIVDKQRFKDDLDFYNNIVSTKISKIVHLRQKLESIVIK